MLVSGKADSEAPTGARPGEPGPQVSAVIVNFNGAAFVEAGVGSVLATSYDPLEVVFVDNASSDGSCELVERTFGHDPRLTIVRNEAAVGPAVGRNVGLEHAQGDLIVFLDNDVEVNPEWLGPLVQLFDDQPAVGVAQPKLLRLSDRASFDYAGDLLSPTGFLVERAAGAIDHGQFDYQAEILSGKSAALAARREVCTAVGGFDGSYYMYLEETDFCWRAWLAGWDVVFTPVSTVYHAYGSARKSAQRSYRYEAQWTRYHACRNYVRTLVKNLGARALVRVLPLHVAAWCAIGVAFAVRGRWRDAMYVGRALGWCAMHLPTMWRARRSVQSSRTRSDTELGHVLVQPMPPTFYWRKLWAYLRGVPYGMSPPGDSGPAGVRSRRKRP